MVKQEEYETWAVEIVPRKQRGGEVVFEPMVEIVERW
jgi:hypothetical protein